MNLLFVFLISAFPCVQSSFSLTEIHWEESRKLTFADFKGAVPLTTPWAATTSSTINFSYETINNQISNVVVYASFVPEKSWMKKKLPEVLSHEQLHFDITEIFARRFYDDVMHQTSVSKKDLTALFKSVNADCQKLQLQYDDETDHGTIENMQAQWKNKVNDMLADTKPYPLPK